MCLVSTPDQGGRGEVSTNREVELSPSRNCGLQATSPAPSSLGLPGPVRLSSSSPGPPIRFGGSSTSTVGRSPRPGTPPPPPLFSVAQASPTQQRTSSPYLKRQDALANSYPDYQTSIKPPGREKDIRASDCKSFGSPKRDLIANLSDSSDIQGTRYREESPLKPIPCLKQRQYSPLPRLEGVDWGLPKPPPRPSPRKSPQPNPPPSTPGSPSFPQSLLATLARAKKVVGRGGQTPNPAPLPAEPPLQATSNETRRQSRSRQRPDSLAYASQSPSQSPKVTEWRQKVEIVRRQSHTSPLASPLSSPFSSPLTSPSIVPKKSHSGASSQSKPGAGQIQGAGNSMPDQLELASMSALSLSLSSPRARKSRGGAQLARAKRPTSSSRESFVFIGCDGVVLAR